MERKRLNADEKGLLQTLFAMTSITKQYEEAYKRFCGRVPDAWRRYRVAQSTLSKLVSDLLDTVPVEQLLSLRRQLELTEIRVGVKSATGRDDDFWVIEKNNLIDLANYAIDTECFCCAGDKKDCRLRKLLKEMPAKGADTMRVACWKDD